MKDKFGEDYFERGIEMGISCYTNFRWIPELTIPMAYRIIQGLQLREGDSVLDYGCAKGYLTKALRLLGIEAYGCDISKYAIENADPAVHRWLYYMSDQDDGSPFFRTYDWIITKDVLEHVDAHQLDWILRRSLAAAGRALHIIPLGKDGEYVIPEYNKDVTHIQIHPEQWWIERFEDAGWKLASFQYSMRGIKENWTKPYPKGNGFFFLEH